MDREQAFFDELLREAALLPKLVERDARLLVTMVRMPAWLSSSSSTRREPSYGYTHREAVHPKSQEAYQRFAERVARTLAPLAPGRLWYEGWNEPEADGFWKSGRQELFDTWASLARGVRAGDPKARVGSPCFAGWSTTTPAPRPNAPALLLEDFIRFSAARPDRQASPDFICWHNFGKFPEEEWWGAASVREWLAAASLPRDLPQVVSEWNLWTTFPSEFDPLRDGVQGAAYMASTLHAMDRAGVRYQTIATLQDFRASGSTDPFHGDFGLMTRSPLIEKASFKACRLLALMLSPSCSSSLISLPISRSPLSMNPTSRLTVCPTCTHWFASRPKKSAVFGKTRSNRRRKIGVLSLVSDMKVLPKGKSARR